MSQSMIKEKNFKCIFCGKSYVGKQNLFQHMEEKHNEQLQGLTAAHFYFDFKNKNTTHKGKCTECGKPTKFNETTQKYERLCSTKCKDEYVKKFRSRMYNKGRDPINDLKSPEKQLQMLKNRKISGQYKWSDGKLLDFTGTYEKDFLQFMDKVMNYPSSEIFSPAPMIFNYMKDGKKHFYIPDFYIKDINLIVEIKGISMYQQRDLPIQLLKEEAVLKQDKETYNYITVTDKIYDDLIEKIKELRDD